MATIDEHKNDWSDYEAFKASLYRLDLKPEEYDERIRTWCDAHGF